MVLVHGALGDRRQWDAVVAALSPRFRTHAVSRRHHWPGPMPATSERYTYELHRDDVLALVSSLPAPAHFVGHSYGAGVVLIAALQSPERVRSLTLIEPAFGSLLPEAGAGLAEEKVSRSAALAQVRALVEAERHDDAAVAFIDWVQGGAGGFARLPETTQAGSARQRADPRSHHRRLTARRVAGQPARPARAHARRQRRPDARPITASSARSRRPAFWGRGSRAWPIAATWPSSRTRRRRAALLEQFLPA